MNRGKPASNEEIKEAVVGYLAGEPIADIAKGLYRSSAFVKSIIDKVGVPQRVSGEEAARYAYLPEECVAESFDKGEVAWSAKYHGACQILDEISIDFQAEKPGWSDVNYEKKYSSKCYSIWVYEDSDNDFLGKRNGGFFAFSLAYDLGKLSHLKEYGIELNSL